MDTGTSATTEPAWKNAGTKPGLQIWRIVVSVSLGSFYLNLKLVCILHYKDLVN